MLISKHEGKNCMNEPAVTGLQLRAGRLGRQVPQGEIARAARVSRNTVAAIEADRPVQKNNRDALIAAYRALGIEFGRDESGSPAVVFREQQGAGGS